MTDRLSGKVALVTGAGSGIGRQAALRMASEGATVILTDRDEAAGTAAAAQIGGTARFLRHDVAREADWAAVMADCLDREGRLDVLVNNAGIAGPSGAIEDLALADWRRIMAVNLDGAFLGCRAGVAAMKAAGGSIVNVSSQLGLVAVHDAPAYCASKGGLALLTKSVALHCGRRGYRIRCNAVHPGFVHSAMTEASYSAEGAAFELAHNYPAGRLGEPDDIAWAIVYLASDESAFATGASFVIDGGYTAQ